MLLLSFVVLPLWCLLLLLLLLPQYRQVDASTCTFTCNALIQRLVDIAARNSEGEIQQLLAAHNKTDRGRAVLKGLHHGLQVCGCCCCVAAGGGGGTLNQRLCSWRKGGTRSSCWCSIPRLTAAGGMVYIPHVMSLSALTHPISYTLSHTPLPPCHLERAPS
jgi:hypothetical protein